MRDEELIAELRQSRVVPVLDPKTEQGALEMIEALVSGGARVVEITLRTPMARDIFVAARSAFPKIVLGAGSVMDSTLYDEAVRMGADFTISPGRCLVLEAHCAEHKTLHIPGVVTPTEIIAARKAGQRLVKFYPCEAAGGAAVLRDLGRLFPDMAMMPSGGIKLEGLEAYAALPGVLSAGGSWMYAANGQIRPLAEMKQVMARSISVMMQGA